MIDHKGTVPTVPHLKIKLSRENVELAGKKTIRKHSRMSR